MGRILIGWLINAAALAVAAYFVPGISIVGEPAWLTLMIVAAIFGLVNAIIQPILKFLTCPLIILTLGLFTLVINGLLLWLTSWIGNRFGIGFAVDGFMPAFWGALVIVIVSFVLNMIFVGSDKRRRVRRRRQRERRRDRW
jgi:putative membrane protein